MRLEDLIKYQLAIEIGDETYSIAEKRDNLQKWTTGKQLIEAADSIAANISKGFGGYFYKENRQFQYYARGSRTETRVWLTKDKNGRLLDEVAYDVLVSKLVELGKRHNSFIKSIGRSTSDQ